MTPAADSHPPGLPERSAPGGNRAPVVQRVADRVTNRMWSSPVRSFSELVDTQREASVRGRMLVRLFYLLSLVWVVRDMTSWHRHLRAEAVEPVWTAWWLNSVDHETGVTIILYGYLVAAVFAAAVPHWRVARVAYLVGYASYLGIVNGFGKFYGHYTGWAYVALFLVLLPRDGWRGRGTVTSRHRFLTGIWNAQVALLLMYTITGLWKVGYAFHDLVRGPRLTSLHPDGFPLILANRLLETNEETLLGDELLRYPTIGWLMFLGTMYLETASLLIAFRPRLYRLWGMGLILFHVGTQLTMNFTFLPNIAVLGLLLVCAPSAPEQLDLKATLLDLPGIHLAHRTLQRIRRARTPAARELAPT